MAASSSSSDVSSSGLRGLEVLGSQPSEGRLEAGRIVDARFPAEHLSCFVIAEILILTQHLHGLTREQGRRVETDGLAQPSVAVLEREAEAVRQPIWQTPPDPRAAEALCQAVGELPPSDAEAVADIEGVAACGFVAEREDRGIHQVVDVAEAGDRA